MARRSLSLAAVAFALASCADGGFSSGVRQFSGVWLYEFEGSTFVEGATEIPTERPDYRETDWLAGTEWTHLESMFEKRPGGGDCHTVQPFLLTFEGRRVTWPLRGAGHMGLWRSEVTVHRLTSAKRLGPSFCYDR